MSTTTSNATDLEGTLVKLDALYKSYVTIFETATTQLESLELTERQLNEIAYSLSTDYSFTRSLSKRITAQLMEQLMANDGENDSFDGLVYRIAARVMQHIDNEIASRMTIAVNDILESRTFEQSIEMQIKNSPVIEKSVNISSLALALFDKLNEEQQS